MKKSLIALAALSAFATAAQAQSSVTVYGVLDIGYTNTENKSSNADGATAKNKISSTGNEDGGLATSRLGFRGVEDLGGGLKANFVLEYDLVDSGSQNTGNANLVGTASTFGARYSWIGLESKDLGQLRLGRQEASVHSVVTGGSAGGANNIVGTVYSSGGTDTPTNSLGSQVRVRPHEVFVNKAVTYISPNFNGMTVEAQMAKLKDETTISGAPTDLNEDADPIAASKASHTASGASLKYAAGKFSAAYGYQQIKLGTLDIDTDTKRDTQVLNATYDFGVVKLFAMQASTKLKSDTTYESKMKNTEVGVQVPMGKTVLWASAFNGDTKEADVGLNTKTDTSGMQLGARYDLSKRTAIYAIYGEQEAKATGLLAGNKREVTGYSVGVRHSF